jgi:hypothetical protein
MRLLTVRCGGHDGRIASVVDEDGAGHGVRSYALDPVAAVRLWALSEAMLGQAFPLARL